MRRLELLITEARSQSQNQRYDANSGISQNDFVRFFNNAQDFIHSKANQTKPKFFNYEKIYSIVSGQESYSLPDNTYLRNIQNVEYSATGLEPGYYRLDPYQIAERNAGVTAAPSGYIGQNKKLLLVPPASTGTLRVNFVKAPQRLDIRRGTIASLTISNGQLTALTLVTGATLDSTELANHNFLCICNRKGDQTMRNIEYDSINAATGVVTLTAPHTFDADESAGVGYYITAGENSANRSDLPDTCERYLVKHGVQEAKVNDSSSWSKAVSDQLEKMAEDIISGFKDIDEDVMTVTITNCDYIFPYNEG